MVRLESSSMVRLESSSVVRLESSSMVRLESSSVVRLVLTRLRLCFHVWDLAFLFTNSSCNKRKNINL